MSASLNEELAALVADAESALAAAADDNALNTAKAAFVGKGGSLTALMKRMRELSPEERPVFGKAVNVAREQVNAAIDGNRRRIAAEAQQRSLAGTQIDATLPGRAPDRGGPHPLRMVEQDMVNVFRDLGYDVALGPEVESDFHNFGALNFPDDHPARDMHDTLKLEDGRLLRTHTSSVQVRTMLANKPPIRVVVPGAVYRSDTVDATHSPYFHQLEGLVVDRNISMAHLKGTLQAFVDRYFQRSLPIRLRPSYFPFTEPSAEVDIQCVFCGGDGCRVCGKSGWIEILGCGMVDPAVFESCGVDPNEWSGFAFGMGIERVAMLRYQIEDIRHFYDNDVRFLSHFS